MCLTLSRQCSSADAPNGASCISLFLYLFDNREIRHANGYATILGIPFRAWPSMPIRATGTLRHSTSSIDNSTLDYLWSTEEHLAASFHSTVPIIEDCIETIPYILGPSHRRRGQISLITHDITARTLLHRPIANGASLVKVNVFWISGPLDRKWRLTMPPIEVLLPVRI